MTNEARKNDSGKPKLEMIYPPFLEDVAMVLKDGEDEYGYLNWQGLMVSRIIGAIKRHTACIEMGQWLDRKSGHPHVAHITAGCMFLKWFADTGRLGPSSVQDDRRWVGGGTTVAARPVDAPPGPPRPSPLGAVTPVNHPAIGPEYEERPEDIRHTFTEHLVFGNGQDVGVRALQKEVTDWADMAIGSNRTYGSAMSKLVMEEIPELLLDPESPLEYADVAIIVFDLASLAGINIAEAVRNKLEINRQRQWYKDPDTGLTRHRR